MSKCPIHFYHSHIIVLSVTMSHISLPSDVAIAVIKNKQALSFGL